MDSFVKILGFLSFQDEKNLYNNYYVSKIKNF